jgi:hypothetical protein
MSQPRCFSDDGSSDGEPDYAGACVTAIHTPPEQEAGVWRHTIQDPEEDEVQGSHSSYNLSPTAAAAAQGEGHGIMRREWSSTFPRSPRSDEGLVAALHKEKLAAALEEAMAQAAGRDENRGARTAPLKGKPSSTELVAGADRGGGPEAGGGLQESVERAIASFVLKEIGDWKGEIATWVSRALAEAEQQADRISALEGRMSAAEEAVVSAHAATSNLLGAAQTEESGGACLKELHLEGRTRLRDLELEVSRLVELNTQQTTELELHSTTLEGLARSLEAERERREAKLQDIMDEFDDRLQAAVLREVRMVAVDRGQERSTPKRLAAEVTGCAGKELFQPQDEPSAASAGGSARTGAADCVAASGNGLCRAQPVAAYPTRVSPVADAAEVPAKGALAVDALRPCPQPVRRISTGFIDALHPTGPGSSEVPGAGVPGCSGSAGPGSSVILNSSEGSSLAGEERQGPLFVCPPAVVAHPPCVRGATAPAHSPGPPASPEVLHAGLQPCSSPAPAQTPGFSSNPFCVPASAPHVLLGSAGPHKANVPVTITGAGSISKLGAPATSRSNSNTPTPTRPVLRLWGGDAAAGTAVEEYLPAWDGSSLPTPGSSTTPGRTMSPMSQAMTPQSSQQVGQLGSQPSPSALQLPLPAQQPRSRNSTPTSSRSKYPTLVARGVGGSVAAFPAVSRDSLGGGAHQNGGPILQHLREASVARAFEAEPVIWDPAARRASVTAPAVDSVAPSPGPSPGASVSASPAVSMPGHSVVASALPAPAPAQTAVPHVSLRRAQGSGSPVSLRVPANWTFQRGRMPASPVTTGGATTAAGSR